MLWEINGYEIAIYRVDVGFTLDVTVTCRKDLRLRPGKSDRSCQEDNADRKFDALSALTDWVEKGKAPERIIVSANPANKEVPASWSPNRTRPLCPYPSYAAYSGQGDSEDAANFVCKAP